MLSPAEGWAVGQDNDNGSAGAIWHYSGGVWTPVSAPAGPVVLTSITMSSPTDGWIGSDAGLLHYDGVSWTRVLTAADHPDQHLINGPAALSAHDVWALGDITLQYNGAAWADIQAPLPSPNVQGVVMGFAKYGWAVGTGAGQGNADQGVILRYSGGSWQQLDQTYAAPLSGVAMDFPSDAWAVGIGVIPHYTHGTWTEVPGPIDVHGA